MSNYRCDSFSGILESMKLLEQDEEKKYKLPNNISLFQRILVNVLEKTDKDPQKVLINLLSLKNLIINKKQKEALLNLIDDEQFISDMKERYIRLIKQTQNVGLGNQFDKHLFSIDREEIVDDINKFKLYLKDLIKKSNLYAYLLYRNTKFKTFEGKGIEIEEKGNISEHICKQFSEKEINDIVNYLEKYKILYNEEESNYLSICCPDGEVFLIDKNKNIPVYDKYKMIISNGKGYIIFERTDKKETSEIVDMLTGEIILETENDIEYNEKLSLLLGKTIFSILNGYIELFIVEGNVCSPKFKSTEILKTQKYGESEQLNSSEYFIGEDAFDSKQIKLFKYNGFQIVADGFSSVQDTIYYMINGERLIIVENLFKKGQYSVFSLDSEEFFKDNSGKELGWYKGIEIDGETIKCEKFLGKRTIKLDPKNMTDNTEVEQVK